MSPHLQLHADAVSTLTDWTAPTAAQEELRQRYLQVLHAHPAAMTRECRPDHLTASTLVISEDGSEVLLTLHAKAKRWFQFGGHCEPEDRTLLSAAQREAVEESGIAQLTLDPVPVQLSEHAVPFCGPDGEVHHLDVRFVAVVARRADYASSEESLAVRWWPATHLPDPEANLVELVALAQARLRAGQSGGAASCAAADQPNR